MSHIQDNLDTYKRLLKMLAVQFGSKSEFVLHDLTKEYDNTIVAIENSHITNRNVGNCGSNLGLEILRLGTHRFDNDTFGYFTELKDGRLLRSSSMYLYNEDGKVEGCICINTDVTEMKELGRYYQELTVADSREDDPREIFPKNVTELVDYYIDLHRQSFGHDISVSGKPDKLEAIRFFDKNGLFLITKAGGKICSYLGISKGTLYSYLDEVRREENY